MIILLNKHFQTIIALILQAQKCKQTFSNNINIILNFKLKMQHFSFRQAFQNFNFKLKHFKIKTQYCKHI